MQFKSGKEAKWLEGRKNNTDGYGNAIFEYAERWANMMDAHIANGKILSGDDIKEMSHQANTEGITGFMYGAAVSILSDVWIHGEQFRRWSNRDIQMNHEGDKANDTGGVLNPALLCIGSD